MRRILWLAILFAVNAAASHALTTWTSPTPAVHIAGRDGVVIAATPGGLVTWERPVGPVRVHTTEHALPSNDVRAACFDADRIVVATANGLARGGIDDGWETLLAGVDGSGTRFDVCTPFDRGGVIAGGTGGLLVSWNGDQVDSLRVPCRSGIVGIATLLVRTTDIQDPFPPGLVVATAQDGVWLLRRTAPVAWLQLTEMDGLPSDATLGVVADALGCVWVSTRAGLARIDANSHVTAWPVDPWLSQRAVSLYHAANHRVYFGFWNGLASFDPGDLAMHVDLAPGVNGAITGVGWSAEGLWWTDGRVLRSFLGAELPLPGGLAAPQATCLFSEGDDVWVGHPSGVASVATRPSPQWNRVAIELGGPDTAIQSFCTVDGVVYAGTGRGLYVASRLGTELQFQPVESAPTGEVRAQVVWQGRHWIGGSMGLWERRGAAWWPVHLWSGASEIHSMAATAETLWVTAGEGGLAFHDGTAWTVLNGTCSTAFAGPLAVGPHSEVWVGTGSGLASVRGATRHTVPGGAGLNVQAIVPWNGGVAVGTPTGLWIRSAGTWQRLSTQDGLPSPTVLSLAVDTAGALWVGTAEGVCILAPPDATSSDHPALPAELQGAARVDVFDVRGRRIRTWMASSSWNSRDWDGTDARGERVASGVYFAHLRQPSGRAITYRMVVVR